MNEFIEKLIGRLEEEKQACHINAEVYTERKIGKIIEIINKLAEEHNGGWIPCSERLPKLYKTVLIQYHSKINNFDTIVLAHIDSFLGWKIEFGGSCDSDCVIAWQPLPEPYSPKGE